MGATGSKVFLPLLKDTSRSFYIGIQTLKEPTQSKVCLAYLFCRILDVVEDATTVDAKTRSLLLQDLADYVTSLPSAEDKRLEHVKTFAQRFKDSEKEFSTYFREHNHESELLKNAEAILWEIGKFDLMTRKIFRNTLHDMATGMKASIQRDPTRSFDAEELDSYCYTVAGTVGLFLSQIFWDEEAFRLGPTLDAIEEQGVAFGKALQIVNITKDFHADWQEQRLFWPLELEKVTWRKKPSKDVLHDGLEKLTSLFDRYAEKADRYVDHISDSRADLAFFCKFPLEMARENMRLASADTSWLDSGTSPKVPRLWTMKLAQKLGIGSDIMSFFD